MATVIFEPRQIRATLTDGTALTTVAPAEFLAANGAFVTDLVGRGIRVEATPPADPNALNYPAILAGLAFFGLVGFTLYRATSGRIPSMSGRTRVAVRGD